MGDKGSIILGMKVKTSVTLSEDLLRSLESIMGNSRSRSEIIEEALRLLIQKRIHEEREKKDLQILNAKARDLNREAQDVLSYQVQL